MQVGKCASIPSMQLCKNASMHKKRFKKKHKNKISKQTNEPIKQNKTKQTNKPTYIHTYILPNLGNT